MALTSLTGIKGVYFYYSQARLPRELPEIPLTKPINLIETSAPSNRETAKEIQRMVETQAFTIAYETNFDLFHGHGMRQRVRKAAGAKKAKGIGNFPGEIVNTYQKIRNLLLLSHSDLP
ncbi:hypothetical protein WJ542_23695 [Paraburkholderia sp. B3]|uniref:hypothetical protein n=1 Tax=Paraburkholderia sp. B3 TaxID=3134791 RepID=UPI0039821E52